MNTKFIISAFSSLLLFYSCKRMDPKKDEQPGTIVQELVAQMAASVETEEEVENYVYLTFSKGVSNGGPLHPGFDNRAVIGATFMDFSQNLSNVGNLYINNNPIAPSASNSYYFSTTGASLEQPVITLNGTDVRNFYSQDVSVRIDGNSIFNSFTQNVRVPADFNLTASLPYSNSYVSGSPLALSWTPDPSNQFGKVLIQVYYHSELSKNANASNPDSVSSLWYLVDDNGSYTIPATALSAFPVSSFISYKIARANAYLVNMTSSSKKVDLYTAVEATSTPIQVILRPTVFVRLERTNDVSYSDPYYSIESTYYKVRYYWGPNAGIPAILVEGINMNLSYSSRDWDVYGGYDEYNDNYFVSGSPGTQEYDGPGYTELFYYSNGYYHQSDYYLNTGDNYTIIN